MTLPIADSGEFASDRELERSAFSPHRSQDEAAMSLSLPPELAIRDRDEAQNSCTGAGGISPGSSPMLASLPVPSAPELPEPQQRSD